MADLGDLNFDANQVEPNSFDLIPNGEYDAMITKSEVKATNSGGRMLKLQVQIVSGPCQNRIVFDNLNLWNSSPDAVKIARGTLSAICRAVNILTPKDTAELHGKVMRITVGVQKGKDGYEDQNKIKAYKPRQSGPVTTPPASPELATAHAASVAQQPW